MLLLSGSVERAGRHSFERGWLKAKSQNNRDESSVEQALSFCIFSVWALGSSNVEERGNWIWRRQEFQTLLRAAYVRLLFRQRATT